MFILGHSRQACPHEMHCTLCIQIISPQFEQIHFLFSFLTKDLMPFVCISFRLWRTLTPYLDVYRFSKWLIWAHGNSSQLKQYLKQPLINFSQFFIRQAVQDFDLKMSSRQPGHAFIFLICARQRRQFIPQGAINLDPNWAILSADESQLSGLARFQSYWLKKMATANIAEMK